MQTYTNIDEYIQQFPKETREILEAMRHTIQKAAPQAREAISYGIPTFKLNGNLVHFGGFKDHVSFFPGAEAIEVFAKDLKGFQTSKGTIQFPLDKPIPFELIKKITAFRVKQNLKKKPSH